MREEIEELYQAEQKQNEIDHHLPPTTAILTNNSMLITRARKAEIALNMIGSPATKVAIP